MNKYFSIWLSSIFLPVIYFFLARFIIKKGFVEPNGYLNFGVIVIFIISLLIGFFAIFYFQKSIQTKILMAILTIALDAFFMVVGLNGLIVNIL